MRNKVLYNTFGILFCLLSCYQSISQATNKIDSTGNIGIGTTSPGYALQISNLYNGLNGPINGASNPNRLIVNSGLNEPALTLGYYSAGYGFDMWVGTTGLSPVYFDLRNDDDFIFRNHTYYSNPKEMMRIKGNGNIGIGNISPDRKLYIADNSDYQSTFLAYNQGASFHGDVIQAITDRTASSAFNLMNLKASTTSMFLVRGDGNVGIGIENPIDKLSVNGPTFIQGLTAGVRIGADNYGDYGFVSAYNESLNEFRPLVLQTGGGNVGIGTAMPSEKLSVNGNISSKKSIVTQTGWSDYVFNDDYRLKPLSEVSKFIEENKHLPEVPTAKEIHENGLDLGDNQSLLLKKIEELTLYIIELKKVTDAQQKRIEYLENQNKRK